jgi:hypothetical protein
MMIKMSMSMTMIKEAEEEKQGRQILPRAGYIPRGEEVGAIQVPFYAGEEGGEQWSWTAGCRGGEDVGHRNSRCLVAIQVNPFSISSRVHSLLCPLNGFFSLLGQAAWWVVA